MKYTQQQLIQRQNEGENIDFCFFWGHTAPSNIITKTCFSQWWIAPFTDEQGIVYQTAEHFMMAGKARVFNDETILAKILNESEPKEVKALGRLVKDFDPVIWDLHKYEIVKKANWLKFSQHTDLKNFLLSTDNQVIVEASPFDAIWGIGTGENNPKAKFAATWRGGNLLGFALMEVRDELR